MQFAGAGGYFFLAVAAVVLLALFRPSYFGCLAGTDKFLLFRLLINWPSVPSSLPWRTVLKAESSRRMDERLGLGSRRSEHPADLAVP